MLFPGDPERTIQCIADKLADLVELHKYLLGLLLRKHSLYKIRLHLQHIRTAWEPPPPSPAL